MNFEESFAPTDHIQFENAIEKNVKVTRFTLGLFHALCVICINSDLKLNPTDRPQQVFCKCLPFEL